MASFLKEKQPLLLGEAYSNTRIACRHKAVILGGGKERTPAARSCSHSAGHSAYARLSSVPVQGTRNRHCHRAEGASSSLSTHFVRDQWRCEGHGLHLHRRPVVPARNVSSRLSVWSLIAQFDTVASILQFTVFRISSRGFCLQNEGLLSIEF